MTTYPHDAKRRARGLALFQAREALNVTVEQMARRLCWSVGMVLSCELEGPEDIEVTMYSHVLKIDPNRLPHYSARLGTIVDLADWDLIVDPPEDNEGHPF